MKERKFTKPSASIPLEVLINFPKLFEALRSLGPLLGVTVIETTVRELWRKEKIRFFPPKGRKITGREKLFFFRIPLPKDPKEQANEMIVVVCTSWDVVTQLPRPKGTDAGWAFILYKGRAQHFAKPVHRTKNFAHHLYWRARIEIERIVARPKDSRYQEYMLIEKGKHMFQRFWMSVKRNPNNGGQFEKVDFNKGLSDESAAYLKKLYKQRRKYYKKLQKEGKKVGAKALGRKKWSGPVPTDPIIEHFKS